LRQGWSVALFGALIVAGSLALVLTALDISVRPVDPVLGPRLFPLAVTGGLALLGAALLVTNIRVRPARAEWVEGSLRWMPVAYVLAGLVLFAALVESAGFVIAAAALFILVARAFRSRRILFDIVIGFSLSAVIFLVFTRGLGLKLPAGSLSVIATLWS
jgi:putative tricarboxylic transport membrane protein